MVVWFKVSQWHEMLCYDPEVMGLNPEWVKLRGAWSFCLSQT